jgi:hypothetical protein
MSEAHRGTNYARLALGAGLLAVAAVGVAAFVPRRRLAMIAEPVRDLARSPLMVAALAWVTGMWREAAAPHAPVFDDLRPFDEF